MLWFALLLAAGLVTSIISETVILIAARVRLKGQGPRASAANSEQQTASTRSLLVLISLQPVPAHRIARLTLVGWISTWKWQACCGFMLGSLSCPASVPCRVSVDNAADCCVSTTRRAIYTQMHPLRSMGRLSMLADSCRRRRDGAVGAACAWTDVWYMLCRSVCTDCLVATLAAETDDMELGTSPRSIERSIRLRSRPCVRLLQPWPAPTCTGLAVEPEWRRVQRSVATAVLACLHPQSTIIIISMRGL